MLDYVDCNIQAYILYVINADNTILFYMLYMIILVCTALHKTFVFYKFVVASIHYLMLNVYYIVKYIVFNYFIPGYLGGIRS